MCAGRKATDVMLHGPGLHVNHPPACLHMSGGLGDINTDRGKGKHRGVHRVRATPA